MKHPKDLSILDFTYDLPDERIARYPLAERDQSKLLVYRNQQITSAAYYNLPSLLPANSLLVFNNTKVVEARLYFKKETGSVIEIFCLEPDDRYPDITTAMLQKQEVYWKCLVGAAKKWKESLLSLSFVYHGTPVSLNAEKSEQVQDYYIISFKWDNPDISFADVLHAAGNLPLPPYMNRAAETADHERYQTVYAKHDGSVAAPTAGLHFTESLIESLNAADIHTTFVTLHVGAGTFKPVKAQLMQHHDMHAEFIDVSVDTIQEIISHLAENIVAVGTTSLRTLESLYWLGVKIIQNPGISSSALTVHQWDPYETDITIDSLTALNALLQWMTTKKIQRVITKTSIIVAPGYRFRIINGLITNFHQPQSTLLLLVAAITGADWKKIYDHALHHEFRFLSYGDGCLLWCSGQEL
ncbi:MAG: S-adenosylmethionine:tRNA ribosyltransferase-isomerase [Bacteroidota bacterium]